MPKFRKKEQFQAVQYTDPASVDKIMDMIGSQGVLNTEDGLLINKKHIGFTFYVAKLEWIMKRESGTIFILTNESFIDQFELIED